MAPRVKVVSYGETTDLRIVRVEIDNFRGIKRLDWQPRPGINCLIGSGDSGKTTILDAIELVFASRNGVMFDDADFYDVDPKKNPISITVTLADIPSEFLRADSDEAGHAFQFEAGRAFRSEAGHPLRRSHGSIS
jgi:recombinational DNA repair ATPase RecF